MPKLVKTVAVYYTFLTIFSLSSIAKEFELDNTPKGVAPNLNIFEKGTASKVPSLLGIRLKTKDDETKEEINKISAKSLLKQKTFAATKSRQQLPISDYTPLIGDKNAQIVMVHYLDLNCEKCREKQKRIYDIYKKHKKDGQSISLVHKYKAEDPYSSNNIASFYGRIAQENGVYWQYFEKILEGASLTEDSLRNILVDLGVSESVFQYNLRRLARKLYSQLDQEQFETKQLKIKIKPAIFVNGVLIGGGISFEDIEDFIDFEYRLAIRKKQKKGL